MNTTAVWFNLFASCTGIVLLVAAMVAFHRYMWLPVMILWEAVLVMLGATTFASLAVLNHWGGIGRTVFAVGMLMLNGALVWLLLSGVRMRKQRRALHGAMSPYPDLPGHDGDPTSA